MGFESAGWWRRSRKFITWPEDARRATVPSRANRAHLVRIATLHPAIGEALDAQRAPLRCYRFIAYAPAGPMLPLLASQQSRWDGLRRFVETQGRWPRYSELEDIARAAYSLWTGSTIPPRRMARQQAAQPASAPSARPGGGSAVVPAASSPAVPMPHAVSAPAPSMPAPSAPAPLAPSDVAMLLSAATSMQQVSPGVAEQLRRLAAGRAIGGNRPTTSGPA
jgi:hypothetical protein